MSIRGCLYRGNIECDAKWSSVQSTLEKWCRPCMPEGVMNRIDACYVL